MFVKSLTLTDFRNYPSLTVSFADASKVFITGTNGSGKTNILEALYYLTLGRSFRKADDSELVRKGSLQATLYLLFHDEKDDKDHTLACTLSKDAKMFAYDDEKVKTLSQILGKLLAVTYDPTQVFFFQGEPLERRKLLDETLSELSPDYLYAISRYKRLLKERNAALSKQGDSDIIAVLKNELINLAYRIVMDRKEAVKALSVKAGSYYSKLFGPDKPLSLQYRTNCPLDDDQKSFVSHTQKLFSDNQSLENIRGQTLIGPHRDDLSAFLGRDDLSRYGSQGENRLASLSLRLAVRDLLKEKLGHQPLLLLDDVTSDLDATRTLNLLHCVADDGQVFVTGTKIPDGYQDYAVYETTKDNTLLRRKPE
ncbi:MAG: DNA replication and repair protein RecF [Bacilli bacterium]|jgi:DNA replication and repair protein RecF|nr:DNA replication and repair protein RecF [Bacilli bacterium]